MNRKISHIVFFLLLVLCFSGCINQKYYALRFANEPLLEPVLLISDPQILKIYHPYRNNSDSLLRNIPSFIDKLSDDSLVGKIKFLYDSSLVASLKNFGFKVFRKDSIPEFFSLNSSAWQLTVKQITIEEYRYPYSDSLFFSDFHIAFDTLISDYEINIWLDLTPVNNDTLPNFKFFTSSSFRDKISGKFFYARNEKVYRYIYSLDSVIQKDFTDAAKRNGDKHGQYLFDFFMNRYAYTQSKPEQASQIYYTFDRVLKKVNPARTDKFTFLP